MRNGDRRRSERVRMLAFNEEDSFLAREPARRFQFLFVNFVHIAGYLGDGADHERMRKRPGLGRMIAHALNHEARFLERLACDRFFNRLARFANVAVKASSMPSYVNEPYPFPSLHDKIRRVVEAYGRERVFWGSDLSRLSSSYRECVTLFTEELDFLSDDDREWIMGRGISEWLGW